MTSISRRAVLAGFPASAIVASVAVSNTSASIIGPDAGLLTMIEEWHRLCDLCNGQTLDDAQFELAARQLTALHADIMATRATTPAGMLGKLDIHLEIFGYREAFVDPQIPSVYEDLRSLCGLVTVEG